MSTPMCAWPHRGTSGQLCASRGYATPDLAHVYCPHHIGEARANGEPYPVSIRPPEWSGRGVHACPRMVCDYCGADGCHWTRHPEARADVRAWNREQAAADSPFGDHWHGSEVPS